MQPIHQSSTWTLDNTSSPSNSSQTKGRRQSQASLWSQFWCRSEFVPINLSENFEGMTSHHTTVIISKKFNTSKQYENIQMRNNSTQSKGQSEKTASLATSLATSTPPPPPAAAAAAPELLLDSWSHFCTDGRPSMDVGMRVSLMMERSLVQSTKRYQVQVFGRKLQWQNGESDLKK